MNRRLPWLDPEGPVGFPDPAHAFTQPNGLVAAGGALTPDWLLCAYRNGIFPWFNDDDPYIFWWSPDPRAVLTPGQLHIRRSLRRHLRHATWRYTTDTAFAAVIEGCRAPREVNGGTWITDAMRDAYLKLHALGGAHSIEVWDSDTLIGGLYGIADWPFFFGESMFSRTSFASQAAFTVLDHLLQDRAYELLDCQLPNPHLEQFRPQLIPRDQFLARLTRCERPAQLPYSASGFAAIWPEAGAVGS